jgi:Ser-tRNA(Ala) deacylase AlaX
VHIGDFVTGSIDFDYRFSNMQNHSGEHIFSGLAKKHFGCTNVGFHLSDSEVTFDYDKVLSPEEIDFLEKEVNKVIYENHKIWAYYPSEEELLKLDYRSKKEIEGAVRLVEIEDVESTNILYGTQHGHWRLPPSLEVGLLVPEYHQFLQGFATHVNLILVILQNRQHVA